MYGYSPVRTWTRLSLRARHGPLTAVSVSVLALAGIISYTSGARATRSTKHSPESSARPASEDDSGPAPPTSTPAGARPPTKGYSAMLRKLLTLFQTETANPDPDRSEERRVGKECRSGWSA